MKDELLENAKRNSKITLEEFLFEFYDKTSKIEQETKQKKMKTFISQNILKRSLEPLPEKTVLIASCAYDSSSNQAHIILEIAEPTDLQADGTYNTLKPVSAPEDLNLAEDIINHSPGFYGFPIVIDTAIHPDLSQLTFGIDSVAVDEENPSSIFSVLTGFQASTSISLAYVAVAIAPETYPEESFISADDFMMAYLEGNFPLIKKGMSKCHIVIDAADNVAGLSNLISNPNKGYFMVFTNSDTIDMSSMFIEKSALYDTTWYSVGAAVADKKTCYIQLRKSDTAGALGIKAIAVDNILYPDTGSKINVTSDVKVDGYVTDIEDSAVYLMNDCIIKKGTSEIDTGEIARTSIVYTTAWEHCTLVPSSDSTYDYFFDTHN